MNGENLINVVRRRKTDECCVKENIKKYQKKKQKTLNAWKKYITGDVMNVREKKNTNKRLIKRENLNMEEKTAGMKTLTTYQNMNINDGRLLDTLKGKLAPSK